VFSQIFCTGLVPDSLSGVPLSGLGRPLTVSITKHVPWLQVLTNCAKAQLSPEPALALLTWYRERDLNPHILLRGYSILSRRRLPFRHPGIYFSPIHNLAILAVMTSRLPSADLVLLRVAPIRERKCSCNQSATPAYI
jgi:hypothetical protein